MISQGERCNYNKVNIGKGKCKKELEREKCENKRFGEPERQDVVKVIGFDMYILELTPYILERVKKH